MRLLAATFALLASPLAAQTETQRVGIDTGYRLSAYFAEPTTRYGHAVLGDAVEYGQLVVELEHMRAVIDLPQDRVFEDIEPRLADVDGDGRPEIVVIETDAARGAQLAVYRAGFVDGSSPRIRKIAATEPIGQRFRWLAPAGIADFDGDGQNDLAYVETPHLGKLLRIVTLRGDQLVEIATLRGATNHRIGEAFISGGLRNCGAGPELVLADANWQRIVGVMMLKGGMLQVTDLGPFSDSRQMAQLLTC